MIGCSFLSPSGFSEVVAPEYASSDLVVTGHIVTMNDDRDVLMNGKVVIENGIITFVLSQSDPLPSHAQKFLIADVDGFLYPGMINAHNHLAFNVLPPWQVPLQEERPLRSVYEWREGAGDNDSLRENYVADIARPKSELMAMGMASEVGKWAEARELVSGTTTTQGSFGFRSGDQDEQQQGIKSHIVRNLDLEGPKSRQTSGGIYERGGRTLRLGLLLDVLDDVENGEVDSFLIHLSEGITHQSVQELYDLNDFRRGVQAECGPLMATTNIIHGTAYSEREFELMALCGTDLVAAPLSNLLYYGRTPNLGVALEKGVTVSISTDWSPVGSLNLLEELKVVDFLNAEMWGGELGDAEIVEMVTRNPVMIVGWGDLVGQITPGFLGDIVAIRSDSELPYRPLIEATEREVALVVVGGDPLYGDVDLMGSLKPLDIETVDTECGFSKSIDITTDMREVEDG